MSLDVSLHLPGAVRPAGSGIFVREDGQTRQISREEWDQKHPDRAPVICQQDESEEVYGGNITHNLGPMAAVADLYEYLWRPEEVGLTTAAQLVEPLRAGLRLLKSRPEQFKLLNPANGWGDYEGLVRFVESYLAACASYPDAVVSVSR